MILILLELETKNREIVQEVDLARQAQVTFKIQVQEWKNTLLRGQNEKDFQKYRGKFEATGREVDELLEKLEKNQPEGSSLTDSIQELQESMATLKDRYLSDLKNYRTDDPASIQAVDSGVRGIDREPTEKMDQLVERIKELSNQKSKENRQYFLILIGSIAGFMVLTGTVLSLLVFRSINRPILLMIERIRDIAEGEGDLTRRIALNSRDETGVMANYLDRFLQQIQEIIKSLQETGERVQNGSEILLESSTRMTATAGKLQAETASIAAGITQMDQNFQIIASSSEEMSRSIDEMAHNAANAATTTENLSRQSALVSERIAELDGYAKEIGGVIDSIVGIADQTNLLALNASIEAAGAGDSGKGFAVVASEVKELARQASVSSEDIRQRIENVQKNVKNSVEAIDQINRMIGDSTELNNLMASSVEEQSITTRELTANIQQVADASSSISKSIEDIRTETGKTLEDAARTEEEAGRLGELSKELNGIAGRFRI